MLIAILFAVWVVNIPFGFWRAGVRKFSVAWFAAVHLPIPLIAAMRILSGLGWQWCTFPCFLGAYFAGQLVGGWLRRINRRRSTCQPSRGLGGRLGD